MEPREVLRRLTEGISLSQEEAKELADLIMEGSIPEPLVAGILVALKMKGETPEEIIGFATSMRQHALKLDLRNTLDTAGTGGDGMGTINVSTASALAVSSLFPVAKHGNRAASSKSGSADFLESLGYNIQVPPEKAKDLLSRDNFVFLFAQLYHPSMKNVAPVRRILGVRTIFNLLGPLTNPAVSERQVMGVYSLQVMRKLAEAALKLGYVKLLLVHGEPGLDEVSPQGKTYITEVAGGKVEEYTFDFTEIIGQPVLVSRLTTTDPLDSVRRVLRACAGKDKDVEKFIRINVSVALYTAGVVSDFKDGFELSEELVRRLPERMEIVVRDNGDLTKFNTIRESL
ncbi:Anthranilate phosphoribosyltransferase [Metallosphaera sp. J1]|uniref:anthranilate phosphoribosyltransferase n=1 Tax=Metallosphaera javensis (ex Hofmann et al. 2022) TaxID=99938 RepID=UPI001EDD2C5B|nr:anthranilate phosphoribosyltransferase [Metallosphaera javensis (ex Hofmann et al. 2022)]MCG3108860.1 Anthranilate phosphoribosyltransferase [Metallosphaera javensis (ex Hofmann et al. 2022)]